TSTGEPDMTYARIRSRWRPALAAVASAALLSGLLVGIGQSPAAAAATTVRGSACSYFVNVGLFGGPQGLKGCRARTVTDGVLSSGSTTVTSASASFVSGIGPAGDVSARIAGTGIPANATITSVTNATTVVISANATSTGSCRTLTITRAGDSAYAPCLSLP